MRHEELQPITLVRYEEIVATGSDRDREEAVLRLGLFANDRRAAEESCLRAMDDQAHDVQSAAALALGHLARRFRALSDEAVRTLEARATDQWMSARSRDALDDIATFAAGEAD